MELKLVKTDDAYPSEGNPREDFGDLEALAATFALNPATVYRARSFRTGFFHFIRPSSKQTLYCPIGRESLGERTRF